MSLRSLSAVAVLAASAWCAMPVAWAQDATVQQVYQAAEAGKFVEAQAMMDKVLRDHPNSGKAHFIEAELLARQGKTAEAAKELATAERLAPGLPFAKPEAVQKLRTLVSRTPPARAASVADPAVAPALPARAPAGSNIPWGMILVIGGLVVIAVVYFRNKAGQRSAQQRYGSAGGPVGTPGAGPGYPQYAGNQPYGPPGAPGAPGMGSGIMGGLATGAAVGAGAVAGGALMHHLLDGDRSGSSSGNQLAPGSDPLASPDPLLSPEPPANYDMGGNDFGVSDPGSWDDGGGGGGSDEWT
jgi:hypothetical protein